MLRLLFVLMALSLASIVQADVSIYIEDFKENEEPGFDPVFNHEFSADPGETIYWKFNNSNTPGEYLLSLGIGTTDVITFNLPLTSTVVYVSVELDSEFHSGSSLSVHFSGSESNSVVPSFTN